MSPDDLELIELLPLTSAGVIDRPGWEARVWRAVSSGAPRSRWELPLTGVMAAACALVIAWWLNRPDRDPRPSIAIVEPAVARRGSPASVGDRIRIVTPPGRELRIYRGERLVLRCIPGVETTRCTSTAGRIAAVLKLAAPGEYKVVAIEAPCPPPAGTLDHDLAAILDGDHGVDISDLTVR
jgi:hypothetical protein